MDQKGCNLKTKILHSDNFWLEVQSSWFIWSVCIIFSCWHTIENFHLKYILRLIFFLKIFKNCILKDSFSYKWENFRLYLELLLRCAIYMITSCSYQLFRPSQIVFHNGPWQEDNFGMSLKFFGGLFTSKRDFSPK